MRLVLIPLLTLTISLAHGQGTVPSPVTAFWENEGEYLHTLLHEGEGPAADAAAFRLRARQKSRCADHRRTNFTPFTALRESGARPSELDMIDHAQALSKRQQYEFFRANRLYQEALRSEETKIEQSQAELKYGRTPASRLAGMLAVREACENIVSLQLSAAETNAQLTKESGLDRDYAYRAFFREFRRKLAY